MKFDDITVLLGEFGWYQKRLYLMLCIPAISTGCYMMMLVFAMQVPEHRCKMGSFYQNDTYDIQSEFHRNLINLTIPPPSDTEIDLRYDQCEMYVVGNAITTNLSRTNNSRMLCHEWVYDKTEFTETVTSKINLVCDDSLKRSHSQMIFYLGVLAGDLGFGMLADYIGRKKTFSITVVILLISSFAVAFTTEYYSFVALQFIVGAAIHGAFMVCCVLGVEMVGPSKRIWTGIIIHMFFSIGLCYLAGVGYWLRVWKNVQLAVSVPGAIYLLYWWFIPESPRWLISQGRYEEAETILQKAAKVNKVKMPEKIVDEKTIDAPQGGRLWQLFTSKVLFTRTMILFFNWVVVSMIYYGVTMHVGKLGGNFFLSFFIMALVEFPAGFLSIYLLDAWGRRKLHFACMMTSGIACLCTIFPVLYGGSDLQAVTLTLAFIGKFGSSAAFGVIYVFSMELYPTVVRNGGMGASSAIARIGGMVAPYVAQSGDLVGGKFGTALPLVIFGAASVMAALLCLLLPETLNKMLPETIEDGEKFGRKSKTLSTMKLCESTTSMKSIPSSNSLPVITDFTHI